MIHVCFGLHDKSGTYSKFTGTTMLSLFENTSAPVTVHILHDDTLTQDNRDNFIYLAGRYGQAVEFYNVEKICPDKLSAFVELTPEIKNAHVSVGTLYRLLVPQILPQEIEKIIYLDSDIIVNLDIKELWQVELGEKILAGVPEIFSYKTIDDMNFAFRLCADGFVKPENYFNAGVLVMNLNLLRGEEKKFFDGLRFGFQDVRHRSYFDQDVLNYCFTSRTLNLPAKFNKPTQAVRREKESPAKKIYHYAGGSFGVGLGLDMSDALNRLWMKYFAKTPWFNEETIGRLYEKFLRAQTDLKKSARKISAAMKIKTRAFVAFDSEIDNLVEKFSVRQDEEIFTMTYETPVQNLIDAIKSSRGEKIFFLFLPNFPFNVLEEAGLVRGEDFFDGFDFLKNESDAYSFAKAM